MDDRSQRPVNDYDASNILNGMDTIYNLWFCPRILYNIITLQMKMGIIMGCICIDGKNMGISTTVVRQHTLLRAYARIIERNKERKKLFLLLPFERGDAVAGMFSTIVSIIEAGLDSISNTFPKRMSNLFNRASIHYGSFSSLHHIHRPDVRSLIPPFRFNLTTLLRS